MDDAQRLQDALRRIYPPYIDEWKNKLSGGVHCPDIVTLLDNEGNPIGIKGEYRVDQTDPDRVFDTYQDEMFNEINETKGYPMAGHWQTLLQPFSSSSAQNDNYHVEQLGDDRAAIMTWMAVVDPRLISKGDWVRQCFADDPGDNPYPYAKPFLKDFDRKFCYDRYWYRGKKINEENVIDSSYSPSRVLNCGYAFSYVGSMSDNSFFMNQENGAKSNFRNIYVEMGLIAHFQKAALLTFNDQLTRLVERKGTKIKLPDRNQVKEFYVHFVEFTQNFWFDEISPQEQGCEIFNMWRKHLRLQEMYDEVRQELKDLVDYTEMQSASSLNKVVMWLGGVGIVIAFFSLCAGIAGVNPPFDNLSTEWGVKLGYFGWPQMNTFSDRDGIHT